MSSDYSEADWEELALEVLGELGWQPIEGKKIAPGSGERESWQDLVLRNRLERAIANLNPNLPTSAVSEAADTLVTANSRDAKAENRQVHEHLTKGIRKVVYTDSFGAEQNPTIRVIDVDPAENDWLAVNQVTVVDGEYKRRFDVVLYLNGIPIALLELKKASDTSADLSGAHAQIMTYVEELPLAFRYNMACVVSDGITARYGTAFSPFEQYLPWNVDEKGKSVKQPPTDESELALNLLLHGLFNPYRMLDLLHNYVAFAEDEHGVVKRVARPHQYFAVTKAVEKTIEAVRGHGLAGVVWHTQGSGKSIEMELYANQVLKHPALGNPTIVVITDRSDLDDQLFKTFDTSGLLPTKPVQVNSRNDLRAELSNRTIGGILFTTLQKFSRSKKEKDAGRNHPLLSERHNIVVIVDEAHRSHYDDLDGYARHLHDALPNATMIAFTGTPISGVKDTRKVFGEYIDIYDLTRAVTDGATVPVYYQSRLIPVNLPKDIDPEIIDERADEATAGLDDAERIRIQQAVAAMNELYGAPDRLRELAADVVAHWEERSGQMRKFIGNSGKGMIVSATREICARLYDEIIELRPNWHHTDLDKGLIKVVYTGDATEKNAIIKKHIRRPSANKAIQERMREIDDPLQLVIVQSMWLTGFDAPPLHTLYLDKPMRGAALMQALARVNRTFRAKEDGLLVGYAPLTENLYTALAEYSATDQETKPLGRNLDDAMAQVRELYGTISNVILARYDWRAGLDSGHSKAFINTVLGAVDYLRSPENPDNKVEGEELSAAERFRQASAKLARFYALCSSTGEMNPYRDGIAYFEAVRVWMAKFDAEERAASGRPIPADVALYLRQLTAGAIEAGGVTDLYEAAGMPRPNLSHLDDEFIARMQATRNPHLAIEALRRLIEQEMRKVTKHNIVRQQSFSDRLIELMNKYTNQNLTAAQVIAEMVAMAREVSADGRRGEQFSPNLTPDELAFYDAVAQNESAVDAMGVGVLADIARDLVRSLRRDVTTDWVSRDDVRAKLRTTIKRLLAVHGYPPDAEAGATQLVLTQMETFAEEWSPGKEG